MKSKRESREVDVEEDATFISALEALLDGGRVVLTTSAAPAVRQLREAESLLSQFERRYRLEMPGLAPALATTCCVL
jgi:hypothetical protein